MFRLGTSRFDNLVEEESTSDRPSSILPSPNSPEYRKMLYTIGFGVNESENSLESSSKGKETFASSGRLISML